MENAVLLGAPVSTRLDRWALARSSVSGRLINGFSSRDWILGLVYRGSNGAIRFVPRNLDLLVWGSAFDFFPCRAVALAGFVHLWRPVSEPSRAAACVQGLSKRLAASHQWTVLASRM